MRLRLQYEFGAECGTLSPLSVVAWPVFLGRCPGPHPDRMTPTDDPQSQFELYAIADVCLCPVASRARVTPPVNGKTKGSFRSTGTSAVQCAIIRATGQCLIWLHAYAPVEWQTRKRKAMARLADRQAISQEPDSNCRGMACVYSLRGLSMNLTATRALIAYIREHWDDTDALILKLAVAAEKELAEQETK